MRPVHLHVPVGSYHQQPGALQVAGQMGEQVDGASVGPVQVFQHHQQRLAGGRGAQEAGHGLQEPGSRWGSAGSAPTRSRISETMRATSRAPMPSSARRSSGGRASTYVRMASTKAR